MGHYYLLKYATMKVSGFFGWYDAGVGIGMLAGPSEGRLGCWRIQQARSTSQKNVFVHFCKVLDMFCIFSKFLKLFDLNLSTTLNPSYWGS